MDILDVIGKIKLDASDYKKGLNEAESASTKATSSMSQSFNNLEEVIENSTGFIDALKNGFKMSATQMANDSKKASNGIKGLKTQIEMMKNAVKASESEVSRLSEELAKSAKETGVDSDETKELAEQLNRAKAEMKQNQAELKSLENELKNYGKAAEEAEEKSSGTGEKIAHAFGVVGKAGVEALTAAVKVTAAAIGTAATGIGFLVKNSVSAYAEFEQLAGGAELMWGEAYDTVMNHAKEAYLSVGRSQSQYLEQANGFATSLKSSLGGDVEAAAQLADEIIRAQADVVAAQGITAEAAENAFNGILRNNFTMLDNLKLGIKPTKEGFQELIDTVNAWNAANDRATEYTMDNYADMYKALNDYVEMQGLSGYASMEASDTITGSMASVKAAWDNLVMGLSDDNADLGKLIDNFITMLVGDGEKVKGLLENIIPRIENAMNGASELVSKVIPVIVGRIPSYVQNVLPSLLESGASIIKSISSGLVENIESITDAAEQVFMMFGQTLASVIPDMISLGESLISTIGSSILDNLDSILDTGGQILQQLLKGITDHADEMVSAAIKIVESIGEFVEQNADMLIDAATTILLSITKGITEHAGELVALGMSILQALADSLLENIDVILNAVPEIVQGFIDGLVDNLPAMTKAWIKLMNTLELALPQIIDTILAVLPQLMDIMVEYWLGEGAQQTFQACVIMFGSLTKAFLQIGASLLASIGTAIRNWASTIAGGASELHTAAMTGFNAIWNAAKTALANALTAVKTAISNMASAIRNGLSSVISSAKQWGRDLIDNFVSGITGKFSALKDAMSKMSSTIASYVHFSEPDEGALKDFHTFAPDMMDLFMKGVIDNEDKLKATMYKAFDFGDFYTAPTLSGATIESGKSLGETALDKILSNLQINMYNTTEIDGQAIKKDSYKYTIDRLGDETRAVRVAMGGF